MGASRWVIPSKCYLCGTVDQFNIVMKSMSFIYIFNSVKKYDNVLYIWVHVYSFSPLCRRYHELGIRLCLAAPARNLHWRHDVYHVDQAKSRAAKHIHSILGHVIRSGQSYSRSFRISNLSLIQILRTVYMFRNKYI